MFKLFIVTCSLLSVFSLHPRNPRRPYDTTIPVITVTADDPQQQKTWASHKSIYKPNQSEYKLRSYFLQLGPIIHGFDQAYFKEHYLPKGLIEFRNHQGIISTDLLSQQANHLVEELKQGKKTFTHFTVFKDHDFNYKTLSGLLILKYKSFPFVLKISIEHPHTLIQPLSKSIEAYGMFVVGGNFRHLSNFTRIPNLERIKYMLSFHPFYLQAIDFPRKWYWKPDQCYNIKVVWSCNNDQHETRMPSIYATISDFIETEPNQPQKELNKLSMRIATDTGFLIDPHAGNIVIEKNSRRYVLLDTEDFRMMVGLNQSMRAKKYFGWYMELVGNWFNTFCFRTRQERLEQSTRLQ